jgi:hypothetical protein
MFSIDHFHFERDPASGVPLNEVEPIWLRVWTLFARNREKEILKNGFLNMYGTVDMVGGLEYHHANFMNIVERLSESPVLPNDTRPLENNLRHEAIAYLNRMGQFYHFTKSKFVTQRIPDALTLVPTISNFKPFRDKHSAHRSIDNPRPEDSLNMQQLQAWFLSSIGGLLFTPKDKSKASIYVNDVRYLNRRWTENYLCFQMRASDERGVLNFSIEQEHPRIIAEAFSVVEKLVKLS